MTAGTGGLDAARRARAEGRVDLARRLCREHLAGNPEDAAALHFLALLAAEGKRLDIALGHVRRAAALAPDDYAVRLDLSKILMLSGAEEEALAESAAAMALRPDDPAARFAHATIVYNSARLAEAEPHLLAVVAARPDLAEAHAMLAALRLTFGRPAEALESADVAMAAGHAAADLHEIRGKALLDLNRPREACEAFKRSLALEPGRLTALRGLSFASRTIGDNDLAQSALREHVRRMPVEKFGEDSARTRVLVSNDLGRAAFRHYKISQIYAGDNFIGSYMHPELQILHYLPNYVDASDIIDRTGPLHVIFNNNSNAEVLERGGGAARLARSFAKTGLPVINPVEKVLAGTRAANYQRLKDDPEFIFPRTVRFDIGDDPAAAARRILAEFSPPFLFRPITTNLRGGLRLVHSDQDLLEGGEVTPGRSYYAIEFHRSAVEAPIGGETGALQFRAAVVGGQVFPDRLNWNEGDFTAESAPRAAVRFAERGLDRLEWQYLAQPESLLGKPLDQIFGNLIDKVGLDIFGIDFGLTADGRIIVFEANASMSLYSVKHYKYSPYLIEHRLRFCDRVASLMHERAGR